METQSKKSKKRRPKIDEKDKLQLFPHDFKSIKENIKKEFLRTVKINNSFRLKGSRDTGMENEVVSDTENLKNNRVQENGIHSEQNSSVLVESLTADNNVTCEQKLENNDNNKNCNDVEICSATNDNVIGLLINETENMQLCESRVKEENSREQIDINTYEMCKNDSNVPQEVINEEVIETRQDNKDDSLNNVQGIDPSTTLPVITTTSQDSRNRKLSLDNSMLSRKGSWSQSEINLQSVGKSPLERKSSFFRKKFDKFFKNTSELFKNQSASLKNDKIQRRGSMSFSLQSLNNNVLYENSEEIMPETPVRNFVIRTF